MRAVRTTLFLVAAALACSPSQEAVHVEVAVELDGSTVGDSTNDLGWTVTLTAARVAVSDLQFTIQGEMHGATAWLGGWLIGRAWAHPGHYAGGDVTGELVGAFMFDWFGGDGAMLGAADMLTGDYNGFNFTFRRASAADDGLDADDPQIGHTAYFAGVARKDATEVAFTAVLDVNEGTQMVGAPFELAVMADTTAAIGVQLETTDPIEQVSLFDGLDFAALDEDGDGEVTLEPGSAAHNIFVRTIQSHVHYNSVAQSR
jgi:hypothetical protein